MSKSEEKIVWKCDHCGYIITDTQWELSRFDYYCPRCKEEKQSRFTPTLIDFPEQDEE